VIIFGFLPQSLKMKAVAVAFQAGRAIYGFSLMIVIGAALKARRSKLAQAAAEPSSCRLSQSSTTSGLTKIGAAVRAPRFRVVPRRARSKVR
jgi:hypothetical protein